MKNKVITISFISLFVIISIIEIIHYYNEKKDISTNNSVVSEVNSDGKAINKEEYLYKDELLDLGYSIEEINYIESKLDNEIVSKYLLSNKYDNLTSYMKSQYFNIDHINDYIDYYNDNEYTFENVVLYVEMGLNKEFYSDIKDADTSLGKLILVNKYYSIDEDYDADLVNVSSSYGKGEMNSEAYTYFKKMVDAAKEDDIKLKGISIFRSYSSQKSIYNSYKKKDGQTKADTYSARPGHSEHETGLAVDINTASTSAHFENTKEYEWLINNSYKYGFILRYPEGKTFITGYKYEPWHYRYVGIDVATKIYEENITYEEYYFKYL